MNAKRRVPKDPMYVPKMDLIGDRELREFGGKWAILGSGTCRIDDEHLPYVVEVTFANEVRPAICTRFVVEQRPDGPPIEAKRLRELPVHRLTQQAAGFFFFDLVDPEQGLNGGVEPLAPTDTMDDVRQFWRELRKADAKERSTSRRRIPTAELEQFAALVLKCEARGWSYIARARTDLGLSEDQAKKWKRKAILAGLLEEES